MIINNDIIKQLISNAEQALNMAYSPYSQIMVGAALLCPKQQIYRGANIENASYSATICAERTAFSNAILAGEKEFLAIVIIGKSRQNPDQSLDYFYPCGICRQWMAEFCPPNFKIIVAKNSNDYLIHSLAELLPHSFGPDHIPAKL